MAISFASMNPFASISSGKGTIAMILVIIIIAFFILALIGVSIWLYVRNKQYWINIHVFRLVGNKPTRIATYKAKEVLMDKAGDRLWFVRKAKKWLPPVERQMAPNEFWFWIGKDGVWRNFGLDNIDIILENAGVKFDLKDMALQRLATDQLLQQRLLKKSFWEQWGVMIGYLIFFLTITISLVIVFHQYSTILNKQADIVGTEKVLLDEILKSKQPQSSGIVPALILLFSIPKLTMRKKNVTNI